MVLGAGKARRGLRPQAMGGATLLGWEQEGLSFVVKQRPNHFQTIHSTRQVRAEGRERRRERLSHLQLETQS